MENSNKKITPNTQLDARKRGRKGKEAHSQIVVSQQIQDILNKVQRYRDHQEVVSILERWDFSKISFDDLTSLKYSKSSLELMIMVIGWKVKLDCDVEKIPIKQFMDRGLIPKFVQLLELSEVDEFREQIIKTLALTTSNEIACEKLVANDICTILGKFSKSENQNLVDCSIDCFGDIAYEGLKFQEFFYNDGIFDTIFEKLSSSSPNSRSQHNAAYAGKF